MLYIRGQKPELSSPIRQASNEAEKGQISFSDMASQECHRLSLTLSMLGGKKQVVLNNFRDQQFWKPK